MFHKFSQLARANSFVRVTSLSLVVVALVAAILLGFAAYN